MRIGIFGGSFNPPHLMHKNIALELINNNYLDKVIYVPTGGLYNKEGLVSEIDRYEMLNLMIGENNYLEVSDYEFGKLIYTYQTLDYFKEKYSCDEIYFICGTDNLKLIDTWKNYKYILDNYGIIAIRRNNDDIRKLLDKYKNNNVLVLDTISNQISSTEIRSFLKNDRKSLELVKKIDSNVLEYIYDRDLYI